MGALGLGVLAATGWGVADFFGGVASRRWPPLLVVLGSKSIGSLVLLSILLLRGSLPRLNVDLAWALLAGTIAAGAIIGFYHLLARGNMSVSAPITALMATTVPVLFGILTSGLPGTARLIGIALALAAIVLIGFSPRGAAPPGEDGQRTRNLTRRDLLQPIAVGSTFGLCLICLNQVDTSDIFAPLLALDVAGMSALISALVIRPATRRPILALWQQAGSARATFAPGIKFMALIGLSDLSATGCFMLAGQMGSLTIIAVLGSLYPAVTILLARFLDHETIHRGQLAGLVLCLMAIGMISL